MHVHRYLIDFTISGPERCHLADAIEDEYLPLTAQLPIWEVKEKVRQGRFHFEHESEMPLEDFDHNFDALSSYLHQVVKGFHAVEEIKEDTRQLTDARKIVAVRGDVISIPLLLPATLLLNDLDPDADDTTYIASKWNQFPQWFQDGMRRKHPHLRQL